eukprot:TRINITY_DN8326_c0_g1_i1.p1 TRINITY_DN8326_c0_g1~~TRINITY_DN8326_c0_g1_i1.p1  ORF type:complete len:237 (+),score=27.00 TRINITY_DN8326_c0_g1_i1:8-718(+)
MGRRRGRINAHLESVGYLLNRPSLEMFVPKTKATEVVEPNWKQRTESVQKSIPHQRGSSLFRLCLICIANQIQSYIEWDMIQEFPEVVRDEIFELVTKHQLITFDQVQLFIHPGIKKLNLSQYGSEVTDTQLEAMIIPTVNSLEEIEDWEDINRNVMDQIAGGLVKLQRLNVSGCQQITTHLITNILKQCPELSHLNISRCKQLQSLTVTSVNLQHLRTLQERLLSMRSIAHRCGH